MRSKSRSQGFTLPELLIALLILGEIAAFSIPKIINAQQVSTNKARAKEVVAMISGAYQLAQLNGTASTTSSISSLTPFLNFVAVDNSRLLDDIPGYTSKNCAAVKIECLQLHNGGYLWYLDESFNGTSSTHMVRFTFDPDGKYSGSNADSSGKAIQFILYYNGRVSTRGVAPNMVSSDGSFSAGSTTNDPSWFSW